MKEKIKLALEEVLKECSLFEPGIRLEVEIPQNPAYGDYATNFALLYGKQKRQNPYPAALSLAEKIKAKGPHLFAKVEVVKPGFINFFLSDQVFQEEILQMATGRETYGLGKAFAGQRILLEFVSANPTGPLHIGHGRWAVLGDNLARLLNAQGARVEKEFYINNVGRQIELLVASVLARMRGESVPEEGYQGSYVLSLAEKIKEANISQDQLEAAVVSQMLGAFKQTLSALGVDFDLWFSEKDLHDRGKVLAAINQLNEKGVTFLEDGALWFKASAYGDDKNRVLVKEDGAPTYFAADIAYHLDKFKRGYDLLINIWGTDHHGYVPRLKAALSVLVGEAIKKLKIIIGQLVSLYRGKELVRMSKRSGEMVTLEEVVEEIGADATRFFLSMTDEHAHLDFDLELAKQKSEENPVYYVQYAHARICSIFRQEDPRKPVNFGPREANLALLVHPAEKELMGKLCAFPDVIREAALAYEPHRLVGFARETAALFHNFYHQCRVISEDLELTKARLVLADATRVVIGNVLKLLGVSAPERM